MENSGILSGTYAAIPNPIANTGNYYYATDTGYFYTSAGSEWVRATPPPEELSVFLLETLIAQSGANTQPGAGLGTHIYAGRMSASSLVQSLPSHQLTNGVVITNLSPKEIYVGDSTVTTELGFKLAAGASLSLAVNNANLVYFISPDLAPYFPGQLDGTIHYIAY
jgi:hypothetical protein